MSRSGSGTSSFSRQVPLLSVIAGLIALAGVYVFDATSTQTELVPAPGGIYGEAIVGRPNFINPLLSQFNEVDQDLTALIFEGLTRVAPNGTIQPRLAESWQISPDGVSYVFNLRRDVTWHDGWPFTADDVVFTVNAIKDPNYQGSPAMGDLWQTVTVVKLNEHQVRFELREPLAAFIEFTTMEIAPAHLLSAVPAETLPLHPFNANPVGTGPFMLKEVTLERAVLETNPRYYGAHPFLREIRFHFFSSFNEALAALDRGDVQGVRSLHPELLAETRAQARLSIYSQADYSKLTLLIMNDRSHFFEDERVRRAMAHAIDKQALIDATHEGQAQAAEGPIFRASWAFDPNVNRPMFDPNAASALLDEAGWTDADGDGLRDKDGEPFSFVLLTNDRPERIAVAQEISRQLEWLGIRAEVQKAGWTDLIENFLVPRNFHAVLAEQWSPNSDPDAYQFWHSSQIQGGLNFASWANRRADELLETARRTNDYEERRRLYSEFQQIFAESQPSILLFYPNFLYAVHSEVKGVRMWLILAPRDRFVSVQDWYVRTRQVPRRS